MTIIELLNKIANGEEVPHFEYDDIECYLGADGYLKDQYGDNVEWWIDKNWLNKKVEILEEENKTEKLNDKTRFYFKTSHSGNFRREDREELDRFIDKTYKQLDLLLDEINKLKEDK